jgi:hypothetical protein
MEEAMPYRLARCLILLAPVFAGCAGDRHGSTVAAAEPPRRSAGFEATAPLDACAVLTGADVAAVLKEEPRKPKPAQDARQLPGSELVGSTCQYVGEGWRLRFFVERGHTEESRKIARPMFKGWQTVPKVGDEAWWGQSDPAKPGVMTVFSGSHTVVLSWFVRGASAGPGTLENSRELVRRALERL